MKLKALLLGILAISFFSCDDNWDSVGMGILPDTDVINTFSDTIYFDAVTVKVDSLYAKTINGNLGEFYDPTYGSLRSGYVCQFYAPENDAFMDVVVDNKIDSVILGVYYASSIGDSLAPMEVSVYPVVEPLKKNYYSNMDPESFCDMNTVLGRKTYTARDMTISDSVYNADVSYLRQLKVKLPVDIGYKFLEEYRKPVPNAFSELESFTDFFKGLYVKSTFGTGNMLEVVYTYIHVYYQSEFVTDDQNGNDSTYIAVARSSYNVTKEVIQVNDYSSFNDEHLLEYNDDRTYVKSPAGIFTKLIIPIPEVIEKIGKRSFSNVSLSLVAHEKDTWNFSLNMPRNLLLINPDSVPGFFEDQRIANNVYSYRAENSGSNVYNFGNISRLIQDAIEKQPDKNLELFVMPISLLTYADQYYGERPYATAHLLAPSGVSLKKGEKFLKLQILATDIGL